MSRFVFGKTAVPGGPRAPSVGIPQFGGQIPKADRRAAGLPVTPRNHRDKKSYTGMKAGIGHGGQRTTYALPKGPGGAYFSSVQLPPRAKTTVNRPSLMNRIARRAKGFLGL